MAALLQNCKFFANQSMRNLFKLQSLLVSKRMQSTQDPTNAKSGKREYVGYGINGAPVYVDLLEFPLPAIRFREPTAEICELRKKEEDDWNKLSKEEIKTLYRYSFCKTFSELKASTGEWKLHLGVTIWACTIGLILTYAINVYHQDLPDTFEERRRQAQLKRMIALEINPITGLASKWDYEVGDWK